MLEIKLQYGNSGRTVVSFLAKPPVPHVLAYYDPLSSYELDFSRYSYPALLWNIPKGTGEWETWLRKGSACAVRIAPLCFALFFYLSIDSSIYF